MNIKQVFLIPAIKYGVVEAYEAFDKFLLKAETSADEEIGGMPDVVFAALVLLSKNYFPYTKEDIDSILNHSIARQAPAS